MSDLATQIKEKAALAVSQMQERAGGQLDYSEASLSTVEDLLNEAADYADEMDQATLNALIQVLGSYVLEVAHRAHGGVFNWHNQNNEPVLIVGEPSYHVAVMAFGKVKSRLSGDKADNIPFFYQGFAERVRSATPGTHALYV